MVNASIPLSRPTASRDPWACSFTLIIVRRRSSVALRLGNLQFIRMHVPGGEIDPDGQRVWRGVVVLHPPVGGWRETVSFLRQILGERDGKAEALDLGEAREERVKGGGIAVVGEGGGESRFPVAGETFLELELLVGEGGGDEGGLL